MSDFNLRLRVREEKIKVRKIVRKWGKEGVAGLPGMVIKDQKGREHTLMALDFMISEWEGIKEGTVIVVKLKEHIQSSRLVKK